MNIGGEVYFAPSIPFDEVRWESPELLEDIECRYEGYFLAPADDLCERHHAFAAGTLILTALESLCRLTRRLPPTKETTGADYRAFAIKYVDYVGKAEAAALWSDFRCGMVHEGRIKRRGQFTLETDASMGESGGVYFVNPRHVLHDLRQALSETLNAARTDDGEFAEVQTWLRTTFSADLTPE